jgi:histidinol-phosphate aminotransferase
VLDSKANFLFAKSDRLLGEEIYIRLKDRGILVRHFKKERIKDFVRITVGTREEMESLILALKEIIK